MKLIDSISSPEDLKRLNIDGLKRLSEELREIIIERVSINGGHLASNLGIVEITIALHYVFDSPRDKIIWDVGHQCYCHKIITGRRKDFHTLRLFGGISGFPKRSESPHDIFGVGHSSTSISASLGLISGRDILAKQSRLDNEINKVIAVIGDGAMTSGLSFEGLNHAGHLKKNLIVILNDNEMSISPNVGALSNYLSRIQTGTLFKRLKRETKAFIEGIPKIGEKVSKFAEKAEDSIKGFFLPGGLFIDLGFNYLGPIDGHDIPLLIETFRGLSDINEPTLVHVVTTKGKGYKFSEEDPCIYHGTGPFDSSSGLQNGTQVYSDKECSMNFSDIFGKSLYKLALQDERIIAITAAMKEGTGLAEYAQKIPDRFFDVGIAEPHAVTFSAGLAISGLRPVVAIYSTFLQRAYDEIIHDVCLQNLPVIFAIDRAGIVGEDGATHQGMFDIAYLRHIPNMTIMSPRNGLELETMLAFALKLNSPVAIRFPRGKNSPDDLPLKEIVYGKSEVLITGDDLLIVAVGNTTNRALNVTKRLLQKGIKATLINARFIKPIDKDTILSYADRIKKVVTIEEHVLACGFGSALLEIISDNNLDNIKVKRFGIDDTFVEHGSQAQLRAKYYLDEEGILNKIINFLDT